LILSALSSKKDFKALILKILKGFDFSGIDYYPFIPYNYSREFKRLKIQQRRRRKKTMIIALRGRWP
jgi:hypothetical protein